MDVQYPIFTVLLVVLTVSGIVATRSISKISSYLGLGHFAAGFIIMAVATGIPELVVGISSVMEGVPEVSLGNVLGSNVVNLSLIIGTAVLIAGGVSFDGDEIGKWLVYPFFIALLPIFLALDGVLSRFDGLFLIVIFLGYFLLVYRQRDFEEEEVGGGEFLLSLILFAAGLTVLLISSRYLVHYAVLIALEIGVPVLFISIILISFGTSLPELVFETISILHGYKALAIGDLMGSTIVNSTPDFGCGISYETNPSH
ncbi:MAG: sodium:calcium antiporter [Methanobacteriaceae archaeon]|nr:sodium:calcium antiporter [Methanobacteriaceae archaeon]